MTKEQINILVSDGDIKPGEGNIILKKEVFKASERFDNILSEIFNCYVNDYCFGDALELGQCEIFKERVLFRMNELLKTTDQKINFLNSKIQEQISKLEKLQEHNCHWEISIGEIKRNWLFNFLDKSESFIETLKFKILDGQKADKFVFENVSSISNIHVLDEYFYSKEMVKLFDCVAIDENIKFLQETITGFKNKDQKGLKFKKEEFTHKEIAIAYFFMGKQITNSNAQEILSTHSQLKSPTKLLQKRISKANDLTKITGNKTVDTKHKKALDKAMRLIIIMKDQKAKDDISRIISTFNGNYIKNY